MDDMERYGDYNEVDESPKKSGAGLVIKIVAIALCVAVVGLLGFRMMTFNYYPDTMKNIYFTPELIEFYHQKNGDIGAITQKIQTKYDDGNEGNFFCDNLIVIPELGQLQITLRYNVSLEEALVNEYKIDSLDEEDFNFRLRRSGGDENATGALAGEYLDATLTEVVWDSYMMYRYCKLVFDGIDFSYDSADEKINWIRLDITLDGVERETPFMLAIYQDNDNYSIFEEYKLSRDEVPK